MKVDLNQEELAYIVRMMRANVAACEHHRLGSKFKGLLERLTTTLKLITPNH